MLNKKMLTLKLGKLLCNIMHLEREIVFFIRLFLFNQWLYILINKFVKTKRTKGIIVKKCIKPSNFQRLVYLF